MNEIYDLNNIVFPSIRHKKYIEMVYNYCKENKLSMILEGSLIKGTATKYSDIDIIILGDITKQRADELISLYAEPVMTNYTTNPKGILVLAYKDTLSIDMDIRETVSDDELNNSVILLKYDENIKINNDESIRRIITSKYMADRPEWYRTLRLVHRGLIKYLSGKTNSANVLLSEAKDKLHDLGIDNIVFTDNFRLDIKSVFNEISKKYNVESDITGLFDKLFEEIEEN